MKKKLLFWQLLVGSVFLGTLPTLVSAQTTQPWTSGGSGACEIGGVATVQGIGCLIANILSVAITGIGLAGFVMILVGGFRYLISGGNSKGTETAKNTLTFAVVGLVVALSSYIILNFISKFTGIDTLLNFEIPAPDTAP